MLYVFVIFLLAMIIYTLIGYNIVKMSEKKSKSGFVFITAISICLKAYINKGTDVNLKSHTFNMVITVIMILSFILLRCGAKKVSKHR